MIYNNLENVQPNHAGLIDPDYVAPPVISINVNHGDREPIGHHNWQEYQRRAKQQLAKAINGD